VYEAHICSNILFGFELPNVIANRVVVFALLDEMYAKRDSLVGLRDIESTLGIALVEHLRSEDAFLNRMELRL
jgi:hypothetical protein